MRKFRASTLILSLFIIQPACTSDTTPSIEGLERAVTMQPQPNPNLDLLFVIDNSGSMYDEQESLAHWAQQYLFGALDLSAGLELNLHIGVISTDLGAGNYNISACEGSGDDGRLQNVARGIDCTGPTDLYIRDVDDGQGGRERNYTGDLADTFACIARLGADGCGYERPLEAMQRALTHPDNAGFLREDALLAVVFITDEDDCSVTDTAMFNPAQSSIDSELGPLQSFRCFDFGVQCNEQDQREPGARTNCASAQSAYMDHVNTYAAFLRGLKRNPNLAMVAGIFGQAEPVVVTLDDRGYPGLAPSCTGTVNGGEAYPGVRLTDFLKNFPGRNQFASICADDMAGPLQAISSFMGGVAGRSPCLYGNLADADAASPGIQPECRVFEVFDPDTAAERREEIRACQSADDVDCYRIERDGVSCSLTATQLAVQAPSTGGHIIAECRML
jgi:hypothetical protein